MVAMIAMDLTPQILNQAPAVGGRVELVEWRWPGMLEFSRIENELMLEMSLPPLAADASASFPDIAPGRNSYMGTLFVRYPGVMLHGRSEAGHTRVIRCVFSSETAQAILKHQPDPPLEVLQGLLNIRSDALRMLMRLINRELMLGADRSHEALDALMGLVIVEMGRLFDREADRPAGGRLAAWQYRRIRERMAEGGERPSVEELARLCGISSRHLHRQFLALTGETISHYLENTRIEEAKELLIGTGSSVKCIALGCGFAHANSFSRAFRRVTGLSPQAWRKQAIRASGRASERAAGLSRNGGPAHTGLSPATDIIGPAI